MKKTKATKAESEKTAALLRKLHRQVGDLRLAVSTYDMLVRKLSARLRIVEKAIVDVQRIRDRLAFDLKFVRGVIVEKKRRRP